MKIPPVTFDASRAVRIVMDNDVEYLRQTCDNCGKDRFTRRLALDTNKQGAGAFLCLDCWTNEMISRHKINQSGIAYPWKEFGFDEAEPDSGQRIPDDLAEILTQAFNQFKYPTDWSVIIHDLWNIYARERGFSRLDVTMLWMNWFERSRPKDVDNVW